MSERTNSLTLGKRRFFRFLSVLCFVPIFQNNCLFDLINRAKQFITVKTVLIL
nr:MAG TPA: hypothetical protein [Caudoviricetes sp.]